MKILAIETSCDETAVALLDGNGDEHGATFDILGNALYSQIDIHKEYGGVYPALAKREHAANLVPMLAAALEEAGVLTTTPQNISPELRTILGTILEREPGLSELFFTFIEKNEKPDIDAIAVTHGPGLEPALWVGVNFARAISVAWNIPIVPINHMEGHFLAALGDKKESTITIPPVQLPVLGLLISGGHTELDVMDSWLSYRLLGATRDDAVGEAYDKVARMMDLPYPGGPEISKLAEKDREVSRENPFKLPRPMIDTDHLDFSFSGLKTAVLYAIKAKGALSDTEKEQMAHAFEDAASEVLWTKTARALEQTNAKMIVMGGGVSANKHIQRLFTERIQEEHPDVTLCIPPRELTTDNALMIGIAGYFRAKQGVYADQETLRANGNLSLA